MGCLKAITWRGKGGDRRPSAENMGSPRGLGSQLGSPGVGGGTGGQKAPGPALCCLGTPQGLQERFFLCSNLINTTHGGLGQQCPVGRGTEAEDRRDGALGAQLPKPQSGHKYVKHVTPQAWPWVSDPLDRLQTNYRPPASILVGILFSFFQTKAYLLTN